MTCQIYYSTMTGHSRKIAKAISNECKMEMLDIKDNPPLPTCDTLFLVTGIYGGEEKPECIEFVKQIPPSSIKRIVLISSNTRTKEQGSLRQVLKTMGHTVVDETLVIKGSFLLMSMGHPNSQEIAMSVSFVKKIQQTFQIK